MSTLCIYWKNSLRISLLKALIFLYESSRETLFNDSGCFFVFFVIKPITLFIYLLNIIATHNIVIECVNLEDNFFHFLLEWTANFDSMGMDVQDTSSDWASAAAVETTKLSTEEDFADFTNISKFEM